MTVTMNIAVLILRLVVGLTLTGHGVQKLFGWFGGPGLTRLRQGFEKQGYKPVWLWISLAILGEVGGGIPSASEFLRPLVVPGFFARMLMRRSRGIGKTASWCRKVGYDMRWWYLIQRTPFDTNDQG